MKYKNAINIQVLKKYNNIIDLFYINLFLKNNLIFTFLISYRYNKFMLATKNNEYFFKPIYVVISLFIICLSIINLLQR